MSRIITHDFETRSECDLRLHGAWIYSKHPSTKVMCLAWRTPGHRDRECGFWHMASENALIGESPPPQDLFDWIAKGIPIEAHNSFFEWCIWTNICVPKMGWPSIPFDQWRCSASKASASALPRKLEDACIILNLTEQKDDLGHRLMMKMSKPRKPRKAEIEEYIEEHGLDFDISKRGTSKKVIELMPTFWHEEEEDFYRLWNYNKQDIFAEEDLSNNTEDLSAKELRVWQMNERMNQRGVMIDRELCEAALWMAEKCKAKLNTELNGLTGVPRGTCRGQVKTWLAKDGLDIPDTKADTLEWHIEHDDSITDLQKRICEIVMDVNKTSTNKYKKMIAMADPDDDRVRDIIRYCGAERTGRFSGSGIQVHNYPSRDLITKDMEFAAECIKTRDIELCEILYGDVMKLLSHMLRGAIIPTPGRKFIISDYAAIEARIILWLAGAIEALQVFYRGEDIYCDMATGIYGYTVEKKTHPIERSFGKVSILGLGFSMGFIKFLITCRGYKLLFTPEQVLKIMGAKTFIKYKAWVRKKLFPKLEDFAGNDEPRRALINARRAATIDRRRLEDERIIPAECIHELALMKFTVDTYRARYEEVKQLWADLEDAACQTVLTGKAHTVGKLTYFMERDFLKCRLPSDRCLSYLHPKVSQKKTPWGEKRPHLSYVGPHPTTKRPTRIGTYGGKLAENATQAVARDCIADAALNAYDDETYEPVMTIHDELVSEVDEGLEDKTAYGLLMSDIGSWIEGCPISSETVVSTRYGKF